MDTKECSTVNTYLKFQNPAFHCNKRFLFEGGKDIFFYLSKVQFIKIFSATKAQKLKIPL
jgi:hypothetical protein